MAENNGAASQMIGMLRPAVPRLMHPRLWTGIAVLWRQLPRRGRRLPLSRRWQLRLEDPDSLIVAVA